MYGTDTDLALRIAKCESGFDHTIPNLEGKSSAQGTFQFITQTWVETLDKMGYPTTTPKTDKEIGVEAGIWLLKEAGTKPWEASKHCWNK